jgi:hypothetical protein
VEKNPESSIPNVIRENPSLKKKKKKKKNKENPSLTYIIQRRGSEYFQNIHIHAVSPFCSI